MTQRERSCAATFLLRLWMESSDQPEPAWRGQVEHVQSGKKQYVSELAQVMGFIEDQCAEQVSSKEGGIR